MNNKLKARLQEKITEWMNENCEDLEVWPKIWIGGKTEEFMTEAAASVFDAIEEFQEYVKKEGYMEDT